LAFSQDGEQEWENFLFGTHSYQLDPDSLLASVFQMEIDREIDCKRTI
jgi:hypothetical protein